MTRKPHRFPRTMPWWRSRVIVASLISAGATVLKASGIIHDIAPDTIAAWTDLAMIIVGIAGAGVAIHSRVDQETAPKITGRKTR